MASTEMENSSLRRTACCGWPPTGMARALGQLLTRHDGRLRRMIAFLKLDPRLQGRVGIRGRSSRRSTWRRRKIWSTISVSPRHPSSSGCVASPESKLLELQRHHLGTRMRVRVERSRCTAVRRARCDLGGAWQHSYWAIRRGQARRRCGPRPSSACKRRLNGMDPIDREVLAHGILSI